jgi:hypothetical protein
MTSLVLEYLSKALATHDIFTHNILMKRDHNNFFFIFSHRFLLANVSSPKNAMQGMFCSFKSLPWLVNETVAQNCQIFRISSYH